MTRESHPELPDHADVLAPPVYVFGIFLVLGIIVDFVWPVWSLGPWGRGPAFLGFFIAGVVLVNRAFSAFKKTGTSANPYASVTAIIRTGPFTFTRNPVYVAMCLIHTGIALGVGGAFSLLALVPVLVIMHFGVVLREEAYLERKHGPAYLDYKAEVRRWL